MRYVHPGEIIKEEFLPAMNMSVAEFARRILVSRTTAYRLLNGKQDISTDMARRLGKLFGDDAGFWLRLQIDYDLHKPNPALDKELTAIETISVAV